MSSPISLAASTSSGLRRALCAQRVQARALPQARAVSSSPYGRTHVWKHRQRELPNPFVPQFPQLVVRVDGSTFTHYTTSPRSVLKLAKDTTNTPLWNASRFLGEAEEEDAVTGRLGRFRRRFEGLGAGGDWMEQASIEKEDMSLKEMKADADAVMNRYKTTKKSKK